MRLKVRNSTCSCRHISSSKMETDWEIPEETKKRAHCSESKWLEDRACEGNGLVNLRKRKKKSDFPTTTNKGSPFLFDKDLGQSAYSSLPLFPERISGHPLSLYISISSINQHCHCYCLLDCVNINFTGQQLWDHFFCFTLRQVDFLRQSDVLSFVMCLSLLISFIESLCYQPSSFGLRTLFCYAQKQSLQIILQI